MVGAFVTYHIVLSVQDKFDNQQVRIWRCHAPSAAPLPLTRRFCRALPRAIPCSRAANWVLARANPAYFKGGSKMHPPTGVSGIVIFIIHVTSCFEGDRFHAVPRSMHSMHWNPLSSTSWRTHPPPEPRQKLVFMFTEDHSKRTYNLLLVLR